MKYYKVVYYDREKLPKKKKGKVVKVCFQMEDKREYLYLRDGVLQTRSGDKNYSFNIEKLQVVKHSNARKIVNRILHSIR